jgi:hypothetical protein
MSFEQFKPSSSADDRANSEAKLLANDDDLETVSKRNEHGRKEKIKDLLNQGALIILGFAILGVLIAGMVFVWHLLSPDNWHWLSSEELRELRSTLSTIILSSAVTGYAASQLK